VSYYDKVYALVRQIPPGRAATYGQLALMTGSPRASRAVGYAMAACTDSAIPCHRVMARDGVIREHAFGPGVQRAMLEAEGVPFTPPTGGWIWPAAAGTVGDRVKCRAKSAGFPCVGEDFVIEFRIRKHCQGE